MPIPGRRLKTEMMLRFEMDLLCPEETDNQEDGHDANVKPVKAGHPSEGGGIDAILEAESGMAVFIRFQTGKGEPQQNRWRGELSRPRYADHGDHVKQSDQPKQHGSQGNIPAALPAALFIGLTDHFHRSNPQAPMHGRRSAPRTAGRGREGRR